jgi:hypothetical protein
VNLTRNQRLTNFRDYPYYLPEKYFLKLFTIKSLKRYQVFFILSSQLSLNVLNQSFGIKKNHVGIKLLYRFLGMVDCIYL